VPVVVSVPHSGTRTLLRHLQNTYEGPERETGPWHIYHFGQHDEDIAAYEGHADIPLRRPVDVMISWLNREKDLGELFEAMERMAAYRGPATFHWVETLPIRLGHSPSERVHDREELAEVFAHSVSERVMALYGDH
jgi:hypothetical protein